MRVLLVGPYSPPRGGVQAHVTTLREFLLAHDVSCEVIDLSPQRKTDGEGVYGPQSWLGVARLLLSLDYDIVHLHVGGNLSNRLAFLALLCAMLPRRKAILTFHSGGYPSSPEGRSAGPWSLRGFALQKLDDVIAVNEQIARWFRQVGVDPKRIHLILPYALPSEPPDVEIAEPLLSFLRDHQPLLVSVGGLEPEYDVAIQIELLGRLREHFRKAGLVVIGGGSLEHELTRRAESEPFGNHVLLCGDLARETTLRVIAGSDVMLRTTLYDGDSIAVREAVHFGVPVIATDRAPRPDGVRVVPAQDLPSLHQATERCLLDGRQTASHKTSNNENLEAILRLYQKAVSGAA